MEYFKKHISAILFGLGVVILTCGIAVNASRQNESDHTWNQLKISLVASQHQNNAAAEREILTEARAKWRVAAPLVSGSSVEELSAVPDEFPLTWEEAGVPKATVEAAWRQYYEGRIASGTVPAATAARWKEKYHLGDAVKTASN